MPTITQLQYLLAVHQYRHFGEAARSCFVSQPTLSAQLKKAEEELGFAVFDRRTKPISPTPRGLEVIEEARHVIHAHQRLMSLAKGEGEGVSGSLTLGVIPTLAPYVTHLFLGDFARRFPQVKLTIVERPTTEIIREIKDLRMDVGFLATPLSEPILRERVLFYDPFYLYAAPGEPLLELDEVPSGLLDPDRLWLLQDGHCLRHQTLEICDRGESCALSNVRFEAGSLETLRNLIDASSGYTIVPETFARLLPEGPRLEQIRAMAEPVPTREVGLVYLKTTWKRPLLDALERSIKESLPRSLREKPRSISRLSPVD